MVERRADIRTSHGNDNRTCISVVNNNSVSFSFLIQSHVSPLSLDRRLAPGVFGERRLRNPNTTGGDDHHGVHVPNPGSPQQAHQPVLHALFDAPAALNPSTRRTWRRRMHPRSTRRRQWREWGRSWERLRYSARSDVCWSVRGVRG